jgi:hypothetical protein
MNSDCIWGGRPDLAVIWISELELFCVSFNAKYILATDAAASYFPSNF